MFAVDLNQRADVPETERRALRIANWTAQIFAGLSADSNVTDLESMMVTARWAAEIINERYEDER